LAHGFVAVADFAFAVGGEFLAVFVDARRFAEAPEVVELFDEEAEFFERGGLHEVSFGAEHVGALDVVFVRRTGKNDHGNDGPFGLGPKRLENRETILTGHFEVADDEGRELVDIAIGIFSFAAEVSDGFGAIGDDVYGIGDVVGAKGALKKEGIVRLVGASQFLVERKWKKGGR
jgi:hypothetical protein